MRIDELCPQEKNPRRISRKQREELTKSLERFGVAEPIVVNSDMTVIGGHQRLSVLKSKGHKEVDCMVPEELLEPIQLEELNIRLNKNTGSFEFDLLANGYDPENLLDWGFDMEELHLESIPEQQSPQSFQLTAKFENEDDLREAENDIAAIIDKYASASYKVKVK